MKSKRAGAMKTVDARSAKTSFSALIGAEERGRSTMITRHSVPVAVILPIADARKIYPAETPSFVDFLLSFLGGVEVERDSGAMRDADL
jgi:hypothetical protein